MGKGFVRRVVLWLTLACALAASSAPALAQGVPPPPVRSTIDGNGVDLASGEVITSQTDVSIGPSGHHGLSFSRQWFQLGWRYLEIPTMDGGSSNPIVSFMGQSVAFKTVGSGYEAELQNGATLNPTRTLFRGPDGTEIEFGPSSYDLRPMASLLGRPTKVTFPDGIVWTYHYNDANYTVSTPPPPQPTCTDPDPACQDEWARYYADYAAWQQQQGTFYVSRFASITSSTGYQIKLLYASNTPSDTNNWRTLLAAKAINNAVEYCSPTAPCTLSGTWAWPTAEYTGIGTQPFLTPATYKDPEGRITTYTYTSGKLSGIRPPGAGVNAVTYAYSGGILTSATVAGVGMTTYSFGTTTLVTNPSSGVRRLLFDSVTGALTSDRNELYQETLFTYCAGSTTCPAGLIETIEAPEHNKVLYAYDARGNVTTTTYRDKTGTMANDIVTSATYPATCGNPKTCNKPLTTTDARNQVTYYDWNGSHGGLNFVLRPWDEVYVRPKTRITYTSVSARYLTAPGVYTNGPAFYAPDTTSSCRTAISGNADTCVGTVDERVTDIAYPSGVANNGQPSSVTTKAGDNTLAATTSVTYDYLGRAIQADGPLSGTADTSQVRYNLAGQVVGEVGPDPDGTGPAKFPAMRYTYNTWGQRYLTETGTVNGMSDTDWTTTFSETGNTIVEFDTYGRPVRQKVRNGATAYQVVDQVYDTLGRVECTVVRMDLANWGTPASSCSPVHANDRITRNVYDELNRVKEVQSGYDGTSALATETRTFRPNGKVGTVTDAEGNKSLFSYDGFDRLSQINFPKQADNEVGQVSSTDAMAYDYDANGNLTSFHNRRGGSLEWTYDYLNRPIRKTVPELAGLSHTSTRDVFYDYDLFGNMESACFGTDTTTVEAESDDCVNNTFNTLGQLTSSTLDMDDVPGRSLTYLYDVAGNLSRITYPDGNSITHHRYASGAFYGLYLNDANASMLPLVYPVRNAQGQLYGLYRWNTATAAWGPYTGFHFDPISRLDWFTLNFTASSNNSMTTLAYNAAGQIASRTQTNDSLYAWPGAKEIDQTYTVNGLNQYTEQDTDPLTAAGIVNYAYDQAGNLTSALNVKGPDPYFDDYTFTYDRENRLVRQVFTNRSASGTQTITTDLRYDPLGRLYEIDDDALGTRRFLYDGDDLVAEYDGEDPGTMRHRYVHGEGAGDDPLVWFEGSEVTNAARRYLFADERGSIVAVTNGAGNVTNFYSYDEYGLPASTNDGAFQYTGQVYLPELGMYYYKARMYSPSLGRFMQTDPIGYGDGMNMYAYVGNDPVNMVDPTGLRCRMVTIAPYTSYSDDCFQSNGGAGGGSGDGGPPPTPFTCALHAPIFGIDPNNCSDPWSQLPTPLPEEPQDDGECSVRSTSENVYIDATIRGGGAGSVIYGTLTDPVTGARVNFQSSGLSVITGAGDISFHGLIPGGINALSQGLRVSGGAINFGLKTKDGTVTGSGLSSGDITLSDYSGNTIATLDAKFSGASFGVGVGNASFTAVAFAADYGRVSYSGCRRGR